mmetsp:Transcript_14773/g.45104  ORF Transcript_14773/g.45104 Transcript_14773/m.45104 type:complete len:208 (-) Transcript_14773:1486-2109(-)|eukprot:scaffold113004_cov32-Tisochrysis_lutea.AAC.9
MRAVWAEVCEDIEALRSSCMTPSSRKQNISSSAFATRRRSEPTGVSDADGRSRPDGPRIGISPFEVASSSALEIAKATERIFGDVPAARGAIKSSSSAASFRRSDLVMTAAAMPSMSHSASTTPRRDVSNVATARLPLEHEAPIAETCASCEESGQASRGVAPRKRDWTSATTPCTNSPSSGGAGTLRRVGEPSAPQVVDKFARQVD